LCCICIIINISNDVKRKKIYFNSLWHDHSVPNSSSIECVVNMSVMSRRGYVFFTCGLRSCCYIHVSLCSEFIILIKKINSTLIFIQGQIQTQYKWSHTYAPTMFYVSVTCTVIWCSSSCTIWISFRIYLKDMFR